MATRRGQATAHPFQPSDTPAETWSDAEGGNEHGKWEFDDIVGEEVDTFGVSRYEIRWKDWQRSDGSNTTWIHAASGSVAHNTSVQRALSRWRSRQQQKSLFRATHSEFLDVPTHIFGAEAVHNIETRLKAHAYKEKLEKYEKDGGDKLFGSWTEEVTIHAELVDGWTRRQEGRDETGGRVRTLRQGIARQNSQSQFLSASPGLRRSRSSTLRSDVTGSIASSSSHSPRQLSQAATLNSRRLALQKEWNKTARDTRAATVAIVNDVDDEEVPPGMDQFTYVEAGYLFYEKDKVPIMSQPDLFVRCDCTDKCEDPNHCSCQDPSEGVDNGSKMWAYSEDGLFDFRYLELTRNAEVIECNEHCKCPKSCRNRVAQRSRTVPIEVFKTMGRGWGARATVSVEKGTVLGLYTGLLMRREKADELQLRNYVFDLDNRESRESQRRDDDQVYSVDSRLFGNWTRFMNHSCRPNTQVFSVVYDSIPEANMPYLAFVAIQDIPARTELTFDYDPAEQHKPKSNPLKGGKPCLCGSGSACRGYVAV